MMTIQDIFKEYYLTIDFKSQDIADLASNNQDISEIILKFINEIYQSVNAEKSFHDDHFDSAYHLITTPLVEFFIARIIYHYSKKNNLNWMINLRRQEQKTAPDIRIYKKLNDNEKTLAIIEIKTKISWMQACFSEYRAKADEKKRQEDQSRADSIDDFQKQLQKYSDIYDTPKEHIFVLIPSLYGAYKPRINNNIEEYKTQFYRVTNLKKENLILLSNNPRLNLEVYDNIEMQPTNNFESMLKIIANTTQSSLLLNH
jgi:hypothetical protein